MLSETRSYATMPASDLDRARDFYGNTLGLTAEREEAAGVFYRTGAGTSILVFKSMGQSTGSHTQLGFQVDDIDAAVADLKSRGVTFEEYDYPEFKSVNSVVDSGGIRAAWFKDSEGNLIGIAQFVA